MVYLDGVAWRKLWTFLRFRGRAIALPIGIVRESTERWTASLTTAGSFKEKGQVTMGGVRILTRAVDSPSRGA